MMLTISTDRTTVPRQLQVTDLPGGDVEVAIVEPNTRASLVINPVGWAALAAYLTSLETS